MIPTLSVALLFAGMTPAQSASVPADRQVTAASETKTVTIRRAALDDFTLTARGAVFNNFQAVEEPARVKTGSLPTPTHELTVRGTYRNRTTEPYSYAIVLVGLDAHGELLWSCNISGTARPNSVGVLEGVTPVPEQSLELTTSIRVRVRHAGPILYRGGVYLFGGN